MKVLVTGANGFIGKNLITEINRREDTVVLAYDIDTPAELLDEYCRDCDFVYNLAGVNRPKDPKEFIDVLLQHTITSVSVTNTCETTSRKKMLGNVRTQVAQIRTELKRRR